MACCGDSSQHNMPKEKLQMDFCRKLSTWTTLYQSIIYTENIHGIMLKTENRALRTCVTMTEISFSFQLPQKHHIARFLAKDNRTAMFFDNPHFCLYLPSPSCFWASSYSLPVRCAIADICGFFFYSNATNKKKTQQQVLF